MPVYPKAAGLTPAYFVNPTNAVIVQATPGRFHEMSAKVAAASLENLGPRVGGRRFRPGFMQRAWQTAAFVSPGPIEEFGMHVAILDGPTVSSLVEDPSVAAVYPDAMVTILGFPSVPSSGTWHLGTTKGQMNITTTLEIKKAVGADKANTQGYDGKGVTAAVVDTGGNQANPQLRKMYKKSVYPFNVFDENGHGTHVAAAVGGSHQTDRLFSRELGPPNLELEGMAPGCALLSVKALGFVVGTAPTSALIRGVALALASGADVMNCSWGTTATGALAIDPLAPVFKELDAKGVIAVCAAGNSGPAPRSIVTPAALPEPLAVGAYNAIPNSLTTQFGAAGEVCGFSSRGPGPYPTPGRIKPDFVMPGAIYDSGIMGALPTILVATYTQRPHLYQALAGTSQAAPIATGLIACMRQALLETTGKVLTGDDVRSIVASGGGAPNFNSGYGTLTWDLFVAWVKTTFGVSV